MIHQHLSKSLICLVRGKDKRGAHQNGDGIASETPGGEALSESPCESWRGNATKLEGKILKGPEALEIVWRSHPKFRAGMDSAIAHMKAGAAMLVS